MSTAMGQAVRRDATVLLDAYRAGTWTPDPAERDLADHLALMRWDGHFLRAALRGVPPQVQAGRLTSVLTPAAGIIDGTPESRDTVLHLRVLIDALSTRP